MKNLTGMNNFVNGQKVARSMISLQILTHRLYVTLKDPSQKVKRIKE